MPQGPASRPVRKHFDVGGFFAERELPRQAVERGLKRSRDETEDQFVARRARAYVEAASARFACFSIRDAVAGWSGVRMVFRGQVDQSWGLTSSLARSVSGGSFHLADEAALYRAEERIVSAARRRHDEAGGGSWLGRNMSAGELLAVLQHQEAPTRFIDVTEEALVALYFATEKEDRTDGRVFIVVLEDPTEGEIGESAAPAGPWLKLSDPDNPAALPWPRPLPSGRARGSWTNSVYLVDAGSLDPRMKAQSGLFLVGGRIRAYSDQNMKSEELDWYLDGDTLPHVTSFAINFRKTTWKRRSMNQSTSAYGWTLRIPSELKPSIRSELREAGISRESLFPEYREFKRLADALARDGAPR